jgi:hypothetical protein
MFLKEIDMQRDSITQSDLSAVYHSCECEYPHYRLIHSHLTVFFSAFTAEVGKLNALFELSDP